MVTFVTFSVDIEFRLFGDTFGYFSAVERERERQSPFLRKRVRNTSEMQMKWPFFGRRTSQRFRSLVEKN